ncbi:MAG: hypothetical protein DRJ13_10520 [Bacteroidetes bacterium]|nr:MAG: hypothetical protein DRJ13_10520 [Bacteroidota bacterium]
MGDISKIQKQTFRYYYEDGLAELAVGILFLVIGLDVWLISSVPQGKPISITAWILLPVITVAGIYGVQRFVKNLKEKYVHPRTGYIEYAAKPNRYRWLVSGFALALAVSFMILPYGWLLKGSVTGGMIIFIILVSIGSQVGLKRLIAVGVLSFIIGIVLAFLPFSDNASLVATFLPTGLLLILVGSWEFRKYLADNPLQEASND